MQQNTPLNCWLSRLGFTLIFLYCLLASIFEAYFAQIHVTISFLPFPIFVGEMTLLACLIVFLFVSGKRDLFGRRAVVLLALYFSWVLARALINYHCDGPLTCRNAALFYYPVFAVFAYCFYQKADIPRVGLMALALLAAGILCMKDMEVWCWFTYIILFIIAVWNTKTSVLRWLGWIFLCAILLLGKEYLYKGPRAHFVSVLGAAVFLVLYFGALLARKKQRVLLGVLIGCFAVFISGFFIFSNHSDLSSLTSLKDMMKTYHHFDDMYQEREPEFVSKEISVQLYNPKVKVNEAAPVISSTEVSHKILQCATVIRPLVVARTDTSQHREICDIHHGKVPRGVKFDVTPCPVETPHPSMLNNLLQSRIRVSRDFDVDESNIVFRLFVWRDMAREMIDKKAWWGFSFGHPQRSKSLEVLNWASTEWRRDGWITPHNSFFHIIYRSGILGIVLIVGLFSMVIGLARDFLELNSIGGGFLVAALVYWLVLSNFFIILEFPYNAIIFWVLFGITCAYRDRLVSGEA